MESKYINTKNLEKDGKTAGTKKGPLSKAKLLNDHREKFYANWTDA